MPTRGDGRNVGQRGANVSHFGRLPDGKLTRFGAGTAILLRKWCTFSIRRTGFSAALRMQLQNPCGSESSASSTTLPKCSRFILHPLKQIKARSLRVAVVVVFVIIVIFFAVAFVFLFVFFLVGLLSKEDIGRPIRRV